jgi:hypothetical protein
MENYQGDIENDCLIIKEYLSKNSENSIDDLHKNVNLDISIKNLEHILNIWCKGWNTFFRFGRVYYKNNKWYWIDCNHQYARKQKIEMLI